MTECKTFGMPMEVELKLSTEDASPLVDERLYRKLVGSLIFLCNTRPDINYSVGVLSRFSNKPRENHWNVGMRILRYLKGTQGYGINYNTGKTLIGFCDSNWAGDVDSRRSVTGYCFTLGSGCISWISKKQPTVALSSTEAEYKAAFFASCEARWLRYILGDIGMRQERPTVLNCDNQSCIAIAKNPAFHARTKHIDPVSLCARDDRVRGGRDYLLPYDRELCRHLHESSLQRYIGAASSQARHQASTLVYQRVDIEGGCEKSMFLPYGSLPN